MTREKMLELLDKGVPAKKVSYMKWNEIYLAAFMAKSFDEFETWIYNGNDVGASNCAFCHEAFIDCAGCPISDHMLVTGCLETPYWLFDEAWDKADLAACTLHARQMRDFIKTLPD